MDPKSTTTWVWDVEAVRPGAQILHVALTAIINAADASANYENIANKTVKTFDRSITIHALPVAKVDRGGGRRSGPVRSSVAETAASDRLHGPIAVRRGCDQQGCAQCDFPGVPHDTALR